ncbi:MAG: type VI secretion system tip protein TssI/VgrG [Thermodesulfobacteriota bacterium]
MSAYFDPIMTPPGIKGLAAANSQQFAFRAAGMGDLMVTSFACANHGLSEDYLFTVQLFSATFPDIDALTGQAASLELGPVATLPIHGLVKSAAYVGPQPEGHEFRVELVSPLHLLTLNRNNRVFLQKSVVDIIQEILGQPELAPHLTVKIAAKAGDYPPAQYTIQYDESDYDFLARLLAKYGLFFFFRQGQDQAELHIVAESKGLERLEEELIYAAASGAVRGQEATISSLLARARLQPEEVEVRDYNYRTPSQAIEGQASRDPGPKGAGQDYLYGTNAKNFEEAQLLARIRQRSWDWQRLTFTAKSHCRAVSPGQVITVNGHPDQARNGAFLVVSVSHYGDQGAAFLLGRDQAKATYHNELTLIKADTPYAPKHPANRMVTGNLVARVESAGGDYGYIDEQGRYRVRLDLDNGQQQTAEASHAMRLVSPYSGDNFGLHFPVHAGCEVLVSCVNGDLDRPVILGVLPNPANPSPVTSRNRAENILRTWAGNELLMDDTVDQEKIELFTKGRQNILSLDAGASKGHKLRLASEQGMMEAKAATTMQLEAGESQSMETGKDHLVTVENCQRLMTRKEDISLKAATDIRMKAGENFHLAAEEGKMTIEAQGDMVVDSGEAMSVEVVNKNFSLTASSGNLSISGAKNINIMAGGQGPITIQNGPGSVEIAASGEITINATLCEINSNAVAMAGSTSNQGGS